MLSSAVPRAVRASFATLGGVRIARHASTVPSLLAKHVASNPFVSAFRCKSQPTEWNFEQLDVESTRVACGLVDLNVKPGDSIAVWSALPVEQMGILIGAAKVGVAVRFIDSNSNSEEAAAEVLKHGCKAFIFDKQFKGMDREPVVRTLFTEWDAVLMGVPPQSERFPKLKYLFHTGYEELFGVNRFARMLILYPDLSPRSPFGRATAVVTPDTPLCYPPGSQHAVSQGEALQLASELASTLQLQPQDRVCHASKMDSKLSVLARLLPLVSKALVTSVGAHFKPEEVVSVLADERSRAVLLPGPQAVTELQDYQSGPARAVPERYRKLPNLKAGILETGAQAAKFHDAQLQPAKSSFTQ